MDPSFEDEWAVNDSCTSEPLYGLASTGATAAATVPDSLKKLLEGDHGVAVFDADACLLEWNPNFSSLYQTPLVAGLEWTDVLARLNVRCVCDLVTPVAASMAQELLLPCKKWVRVQIWRGSLGQIFSVHQDITALKVRLRLKRLQFQRQRKVAFGRRRSNSGLCETIEEQEEPQQDEIDSSHWPTPSPSVSIPGASGRERLSLEDWDVEAKSAPDMESPSALSANVTPVRKFLGNPELGMEDDLVEALLFESCSL
mmetsp:Transcript_2088/g.4795  ORF Transcript_2088/g.4795 Transcript_2088/m.4795 type:complete len:256 (+) Transcript_2088:46-813(+)